MNILKLFTIASLVSISASAFSGLPQLETIKYESGMVTMRTADAIPKSTNSMNDMQVIESYRRSLIDRGYKQASCAQVDGYGLSYAVQCVAVR